MKTTRHVSTSRERQRSGLAPLELVLALPIMLFAMALMVNIGSVGAWKVRAQANVRNASWRTLHLRSGDANPNPAMWPSSANVSSASGNDMTQPTQVWDVLPDLRTPSVRGRVVVAPNVPDSFIAVNPMLEIDQGVHDGRAPLERQIPMLRGILPRNGRYYLDIQQNVLDGNWEYHNIKFRGQGYWRNRDQRAAVLYEIEAGDFPSSAQLQQQTRRILLEIQNPQNYSAPGSWASLEPLDADEDLGRLSLLPPRNNPNQPANPYGNSGAPQPNPPDLYPGRRVIRACLADPSMLRSSQRFTDYMEEIQRLPGSVARTFRSWYQSRINYLEQQTPPSPAASQEIQQLQDEIDLLDQFLGALPQQNR